MGGYWSDREFVSCQRWIDYNSKFAAFVNNWDLQAIYQCPCGWKSLGSQWKCAKNWLSILVQCPKCLKEFPYAEIAKPKELTKTKKAGRLRK